MSEERNLQPTQMSVTKPDEHKVICPCGEAMNEIIIKSTSAVDEKYRFSSQYRCVCGWSAPIRYGKTESEAHEAAYAAATRRPPNKPLNREQIRRLSPDDAIWTYQLHGDLVWVLSARYVQNYILPCLGWESDIMFASKPSPADIDAARKDRKNE